MGWVIQPTTAQQTEKVTDVLLEGSVVDAHSDEPLANVTVRILELDKKAETDEDGEFSFQHINPDGKNTEVTLHTSHEGYKEFSTTIQLDETSKIKLELEPESEEEE